MTNGENEISAKTAGNYLKALRKIFVIEDSEAWNPNLRSKTAARTANTRYFIDPSIGTAVLGLGPKDLVSDLNTMGLFFETLCIRDLRVFADALDGNVYHYRDKNGLECDAVVHLRNGKYGLVKTKPVSPSVAPTPRPVRPVVQTPTASQPKAQVQSTQTAFTINTGDEVKKVWIPNSVKDVFTNEVQIPEDNDIATTENVAHVAMLLFAGYIDAATSMSENCGGGGSAPSSGWGKKDDEDDWKFAHRCAQMAHSMCKPKPRSRNFHR